MSLKNTNLGVTFISGETATIGGQSVTLPVNHSSNHTQMTDGTGTNKAQKFVPYYNASIDTTGVTLDLSAIAGLNGNANLSKIKGLLILNKTVDATDAAGLIVGAAAADAWEAFTTVAGATIRVPAASDSNTPGVLFLSGQGAGLTVDATHKNLKLAAQTGTVEVQIYIVAEGT